MAHVYDNHFQAYTDASSRHTAQRVTTFLREHLAPDSVLDVGCARGGWLAAWQQAGVGTIHGLDGDYVERSQLAIPEDALPARTCPDRSTGPAVRSGAVTGGGRTHPARKRGNLVANLVRHSRAWCCSRPRRPGRAGNSTSTSGPTTIGAACSPGTGIRLRSGARSWRRPRGFVLVPLQHPAVCPCGKQAALPAARPPPGPRRPAGARCLAPAFPPAQTGGAAAALSAAAGLARLKARLRA